MLRTYLASQLGEGRRWESIGFRVRGESKTSSATRFSEIVTEGTATRMIQTDRTGSKSIW
ncbi:hypothetical protein OK016_05830 [Vibrio chagasii]|nr:hypothetical protein [Vibrio chagasii]